MFAAEGGDDNEIPDSDRADGLELDCLQNRAERRGAAKRQIERQNQLG